MLCEYFFIFGVLIVSFVKKCLYRLIIDKKCSCNNMFVVFRDCIFIFFIELVELLI